MLESRIVTQRFTEHNDEIHREIYKDVSSKIPVTLCAISVYLYVPCLLSKNIVTNPKNILRILIAL